MPGEGAQRGVRIQGEGWDSVWGVTAWQGPAGALVPIGVVTQVTCYLQEVSWFPLGTWLASQGLLGISRL